MSPITAQDLLNLSLSGQLWLVFVAGIFTSFTPCVYPLIPVTLAIFKGDASTSRLKSFLVSLCYVFGIATTYTGLGLVSALTGSFFGSFIANPFVSLGIGILLIILALAGLDIFRFQFAGHIQNKASKVGGAGFTGAFAMGLVSGVIAAPCTGPVLASILLVAGSSGKPGLGSLLLFVHALGLGMIFVVLGTYHDLAKKIPRSGSWLGTTKLIMSSAIIIVALMFLSPFFKYIQINPFKFYEIIVITIAIISSFILGLIASSQDVPSLKIFSALTLAFTCFGIPLAIERSSTVEKETLQVEAETLTWTNSIDAGVATAQDLNKIAIVDLYADWCGACKEYDSVTFKDEEVIKALKSRFVPTRVDFTIPNDTTDEIERDFKVIGLPTILFIDGNGTEIKDSRLTGFLEPKDFLAHLKKITPP